MSIIYLLALVAKGIGNMGNDEKKNLFEAGTGFIAKSMEYTAEGMKNPKAVEMTKGITNSLSNNSEAAKAGANFLKGAVGAAAGLGAAGTSGAITTGGAAGIVAAATPFLPAVAVLSVGGLAAYGLYKVLEDM